MIKPLFMNVWGNCNGAQWTDASLPYAINTRAFCDTVATDIHSQPNLGIRRIALLRIYPKQERQS